MSLIELQKILEATGCPVAYSHFTPTEDEPMPEPPYICVISGGSPNMAADNKVYYKIDDVNIELYTLYKDFAVEAKIEAVLNEYELPFVASPDIFIETENLYQKIYETRLI